MKKFRYNSFLRQIAFFTVFNMVWEISFPALAWALTGGPSQPEVQSFEPVGTTEMVELSSGDFVYNIPLLDVGGYPINLSYHGGITMEQEASWVGLGWNINPGVINRNLRGLPDDFKGDKVERTFFTKNNWTVGLAYTKTKNKETFGFNKEVYSAKELEAKMENSSLNPYSISTLASKSISFTLGINYNNYKGIGYDFSLGKSNAKVGGLNLGYSSSNGFNVGGSIALIKGNPDKIIGGLSPGFNFNSRQGLTNASLGTTTSSFSKRKNNDGDLNLGFNLGEVNSTPSPQTTFYSFGGSLAYSGGNVIIPGRFREKNKFVVNFSISGVRQNDKTYESYGYLYQNNSQDADNKSDFSRVFDEQINKSTVYMPMAQKTYDAFSASGQGTGSGIRFKESYISPVADPINYVASAINPDLGVEFASKVSPNSHVGINLRFNTNTGVSRLWKRKNKLIDIFPKNIYPKSIYNPNGFDNLFEPVYFQSMGENVPIDKEMFENLKGEAAINCTLDKKIVEIGINSDDIGVAENRYKLSNRAKRNQVTSYLTAENAALAGVSKQIENYPAIGVSGPTFEDNIIYTTSSDNIQPYQKRFYSKTNINRVSDSRKAHHLSEITTLNPDGTRYVYGIPAYNYSTVEQTFAVEAGTDLNLDFDNYDTDNNNIDDDLSIHNNKGLDHFYLNEKTPAYPHSFLLTSILSSDYVDIKQDGITDDDYGNYVKINYSKLIPMTQSGTPLPNSNIRWRAPYENARLQKGLESDLKDDKASFVEGTKEIWYMHSIETKDYVAEFYTSYRNDGLDARDNIKGGRGNIAAKKLDKIVLYNRYDRKQNGESATPIKTVHFDYDYSLCVGVLNQINRVYGKLTLKKVWFSYGKIINNAPIAPYEFTYPDYNTNANPNYKETYHDYWGNYQNFASVFGGKYASNPDDFPYVDQEADKTMLDQNASAWNLTEIRLPSGGKIKINYEADDYAYVQDKNAMEFFQILGFSETFNSGYNNILFTPSTNYNYIHFKLHTPVPVTDQEFKERYLKGNTQFLVFVKMKINPLAGDKEEWVKAYVTLDDGGTHDYGILNGHGFIRVKSISVYNKSIKDKDKPESNNEGINPIARAGWEFVKENLPWEVFPQSDLNRTTSSDNINKTSIKKIGIKLFTAIPSIILGPNIKLKHELFCSETNIAHSYIRLNDPDGRKIGGGCRVKSIQFSDAWDVISGNAEDEHIYGQVYDYTTKDEKGATISSGVLDYEPLMGGLECPFKIPFVNRHNKKLTPSQDYHYADEPVYEGYIPSGNLIYSKITVRNIKPKDINSSNPDITRHGTGYVVNEFYTAKDFPLSFIKTSFEHKIKRNWALKLLGTNKTMFAGYQGYSLIINDMHGKPKGNKVFNEYNKQMSSVEYVYQTDPGDPRKLKNEVSVIKADGDIVNNEIIGVDYDVTMDPKEVKQVNFTFGLDINIDGQFNPAPVIVPSFWPQFKINHEGTRTMSITKIINKRGLIKKVVAYDLEARVETENLLYDAETGEVLLTSVNNEYGEKQYNFKQPAHWVYEGMSGAYKNIGAEVPITLTNGYGTDLSNALYPGDELLNIKNRTPIEKAWVISRDANNSVKIVTKINGVESCVPNGSKIYLILRSGRRNVSSAPIGEIAAMDNPIDGTQLTFDNILASSAVEYTDNWPAFKNLKFNTVFCPDSPPPPPPIPSHCYFGCESTSLPHEDPCDPEIPGSKLQDPEGLLANIDVLYKTEKLAPGGFEVFYDPISQKCFYFDPCFVHEFLPCDEEDDDEVIVDLGDDGNGGNDDEDPIDDPDDELKKKDDGFGFRNEGYSNFENLAFNFEIRKFRGPNVFDDILAIESETATGSGQECGLVIDPVYKYKSCRKQYSSTLLGDQYRFKFNLYTNSACSKPNCSLVFINNRGTNGQKARSANYLYNLALNNPPGIVNSDCHNTDDITDYNNYWLEIVGGDLDCANGQSDFWAHLRGKYMYNKGVVGPYPLKSITFKYKDIERAFKVFKTCKQCPETTNNKRVDAPNTLSSQIPYLNGTKGNWRPKVSYSYFEKENNINKRSLVTANNSTDPNKTIMKNSGTILQANYKPFWKQLTLNGPWQKDANAGTSTSPWIATNEVTLVNPNSQELENKNALGIYSSALYSQFQNQAIAVAQNARYQNILFENFEDYEHGMAFDGNCVPGSGSTTVQSNFSPQIMQNFAVHWPLWTIFYENKVTPSKLESHSGATSLKITQGTYGLCLGDRTETYSDCKESNVPMVPTFYPERGTYILDFWAKHGGADNLNIINIFTTCGGFEIKKMGEVVTVDGWRKYTFEVRILDDINNINLTFKNTTGGDLYIDDLRIQPMSSEMKGFVYEKINHRLTAELDANNYATFYEYDEQGNLIRVKKETEKGIVTIKENRQYIKKN